jgi:hypothetical protein
VTVEDDLEGLMKPQIMFACETMVMVILCPLHTKKNVEYKCYFSLLLLLFFVENVLKCDVKVVVVNVGTLR